jgi:hypothetical protein
MPVGRWSTVKEAAREIGVTRQRVHQLIRKGLLGEARMFSTPRGPVWMIRRPIERRLRPSGYHRPECKCGKHPGERRTQ